MMHKRQHENSLTMSVESAAQLLGISRGLAYEMVHQGKIPALRFGRVIRVPVCALERLLEGREGDIETSNITRER